MHNAALSKKILFVTVGIPYPFHSGSAIKAYQALLLLRELFEVDLMCYAEGKNDAPAMDHFKTLGIEWRGIYSIGIKCILLRRFIDFFYCSVSRYGRLV